MNLNKVFILGRLTGDPQLRRTASGQTVATMGLATNRTWTDKDGQKQEAVEFHSVVIWGKQAENAAAFLIKGQIALVEGSIQTRAWTDKDGHERKATEIIAQNIQFGPKPGEKPAPAKPHKPIHTRPDNDFDDENVSQEMLPL